MKHTSPKVASIGYSLVFATFGDSLYNIATAQPITHNLTI